MQDSHSQTPEVKQKQKELHLLISQELQSAITANAKLAIGFIVGEKLTNLTTRANEKNEKKTPQGNFFKNTFSKIKEKFERVPVPNEQMESLLNAKSNKEDQVIKTIKKINDLYQTIKYADCNVKNFNELASEIHHLCNDIHIVAIQTNVKHEIGYSPLFCQQLVEVIAKILDIADKKNLFAPKPTDLLMQQHPAKIGLDKLFEATEKLFNYLTPENKQFLQENYQINTCFSKISEQMDQPYLIYRAAKAVDTFYTKKTTTKQENTVEKGDYYNPNNNL